MAAPCSVKARGAYLILAPQLKVTDCDLEISAPRGEAASKVTDCDLRISCPAEGGSFKVTDCDLEPTASWASSSDGGNAKSARAV